MRQPPLLARTILAGMLPLMSIGCSNDGASTDAATSPGTSADSATTAMAKNPATAEKMAIDRFSDAAGHLQKRSASPSLPGPNQPVDFDHGPFITNGFGPNGEKIR